MASVLDLFDFFYADSLDSIWIARTLSIRTLSICDAVRAPIVVIAACRRFSNEMCCVHSKSTLFGSRFWATNEVAESKERRESNGNNDSKPEHGLIYIPAVSSSQRHQICAISVKDTNCARFSITTFALYISRFWFCITAAAGVCLPTRALQCDNKDEQARTHTHTHDKCHCFPVIFHVSLADSRSAVCPVVEWLMALQRISLPIFLVAWKALDHSILIASAKCESAVEEQDFFAQAMRFVDKCAFNYLILNANKCPATSDGCNTIHHNYVICRRKRIIWVHTLLHNDLRLPFFNVTFPFVFL